MRDLTSYRCVAGGPEAPMQQGYSSRGMVRAGWWL